MLRNDIYIYIYHILGSKLTSQTRHVRINLSSPGQNGRHFADDIFICIFLNEKFCILIRMSPKLIPKGPIDNKWALVRVMAWRRIGNK